MWMLGKLGATLAVCCGLMAMSISSAFAETIDEKPVMAEQAAKLEQDFELLSAGTRLEPNNTYETPEQPTVYLTFDDGPSKLTGQVLDILKQEGVQATFFVIGNSAQGEDKLLKRITVEGHAIGNHSYDHVYKDLYGNFAAFWEQVQKTDLIIEKATGRKPELIRAPGGSFANFDPFYFYYLEEAGYSAFDWNIDSGDASRRGVPADEIVRNVKQSPLQHELVVLMHDGTGHEETVKALPEIIQYFKQKDYAFAPIDLHTRPVQFRLGKSRWNRSYRYESFVDAASKAFDLRRKRSGGKEPDHQPQPPKVEHEPARKETKPAQEDPIQARKSLSVFLGAVPWVLYGGQYEFEFGRFSVPLRAFVERLGGKISWDDSNQTALVQIGSKTVQYDPIHKRVRIFEPGMMPKVSCLADLQLTDGTIYAPLRGTTKLFGGSINRYRLAGDRFRVDVAWSMERAYALFARQPSFRWQTSFS